MLKKGDTLVEVTIAIGIFSLVAISVASIMNSSTSDAQLALETTLAREEIDAQAEALRFIHDSYASNKQGSSQPIYQTWEDITGRAINVGPGASGTEAILQYAPLTCESLFSNTDIRGSAFVLNPTDLNSENALVEYNSSIFRSTSTYPRLVYGNDNANLYDTSISNDLTGVEGIYVIPVAPAASDPAYYDFYIRTCWQGGGTGDPSTISTVIRLYNSDVTSNFHSFTAHVYNGAYGAGQSGSGGAYSAIDNPYTWHNEPVPAVTYVEHKGKSIVLQGQDEKGWNFYYCDYDYLGAGESTCEAGHIYEAGQTITNQTGDYTTYNFYPVWEHIKYTVNYNSNGSSWTRDPQTCYIDGTPGDGDNPEDKCVIERDDIKKSGYTFKGWCSGSVNGSTCNGTTYQQGYEIPMPSGFPNSRELTLTAIWSEHNEVITINADWTSDTDYDSQMELSLPGSDSYQFANYGTSNINVTYNGQTYSLITGDGDGRGSINSRYYEKFTINTLGGKNYYYSIRKYPSGDVGNDITIRVTIQDPNGNTSTTTYYSSNRPNSSDCNYWNVFGYVDGEMITRNTCSSSMEYNYR